MASPAQATPGDPPGPGGGEPTIMAFRRPLDRPALAARPAAAGSGDVPVVLKLPDLARPAGAALPDSESAASTRPWIATALWTATGLLAVVAVAVLLVGKPTSEPAMDDAPSWQTPPISGPAPSNGGSQAPPLAQPGGTPAGAYPQTQTPSDGQTWNDRGAIGRSFESQPPSGYPASETQPGSGTVQGPATGGQYLGGGLPATGYSSAGYPSTAPPGGSVYRHSACAVPFPAAAAQPVDQPNGPAAGGDFSSPETPRPDQTKNLELHNYPLPTVPGATTGTARLDGGIGYPERRPGDDSTR